MAENYKEKLKDPRWQKKRLEIMQRDNFTCRKCGDKDSTLHVHHLIYTNIIEPWGYQDRCYLTLCENCHQSEHEINYKFYEYFTRYIATELNITISELLEMFKDETLSVEKLHKLKTNGL